MSENRATGVPCGVLVCVRRTLREGSTEGAMIGGGFWRRQPYECSVYLLYSYQTHQVGMKANNLFDQKLFPKMKKKYFNVNQNVTDDLSTEHEAV